MATSSLVAATSPPFFRRCRRIFLTTCHQHHGQKEPNPTPHLSRRRSLTLLSVAAMAVKDLPHPAFAVADETVTLPSPSADALPAVTDRVFMDFSICPTYLRAFGGATTCAVEDAPLGRVVFGLYGKVVPTTAANFKAMCTAAAYRGSVIHKVLPGQFFMAGRQGRGEKGGAEIRPPEGLIQPNDETINSESFKLRHVRPGTLSLCLNENDDDDDIKLDPEYRNVEFLVTTGPGPCPQLDDGNIVFGTVLEGMDVITSIATMPTYKPAERVRQLNDFAEFLGDERAQIARSTWNRPLKMVYISNCGELMVAKPSLSPPALP